MKTLAFFFALVLVSTGIFLGARWHARETGEAAGKAAAKGIEQILHVEPQTEKAMIDEANGKAAASEAAIHELENESLRKNQKH